MISIRVNKRNKAKELLKEIFNNEKDYYIIHYSCESFSDKEDGGTPRITSIGLRKLDSGQTKSFCTNHEAELNKIEINNIEEHYNKLEKDLLEKYFEFLKEKKEYHFIHWNMRDENYGFYALERRFRVLGGEPFSLDDSKKIDLSRILVDIYKKNYISHPRLPNIINKNKITTKGLLTGEEESTAFEEKNFIKLHNSTLRKLDSFSNILQLSAEDKLKVDTSIFEQLESPKDYLKYYVTNSWVLVLVSHIIAIYTLIQIIINYLN